MSPSTRGVVGGAVVKVDTFTFYGFYEFPKTLILIRNPSKFTFAPAGDAVAVDGGGESGGEWDDGWRKGWPLPPPGMATLRRRPPLTWSCLLKSYIELSNDSFFNF